MAKKIAVKKPRNRAAQEATLINMRALQKRVVSLEVSVRLLKATVGHLSTRLSSPRGDWPLPLPICPVCGVVNCHLHSAQQA